MSYEHDDEEYETEQPKRYGSQRRGYSHSRDSEVLSHRDVNDFAGNAFKNSAVALKEAEIGKTQKWFGFEVDEGVVAYFKTIYNMGSHYLANMVSPKAAQITERYGHHVGLQKGQLKAAAAIAHIGSTVALKTSGYVAPLWKSFSAQRQERAQLARMLAPVLDDIKGNHSVSALYSVTQTENSVLFAHRKRLAKIASHENMSKTIDLGLNSGSNIMFDLKSFAATWKGNGVVTAHEIEQMHQAKMREQEARAHYGEAQGQFIGNALVSTTVPQLIERLQDTSQHKLEKSLQPYSALEMILELNKQVDGNPESRGFQAPANFKDEHARREEYSLEEYLMRICIQHQKEMADISPQHTEIREALRENLAAAIKPVAAAIRKGDLNVLSLVRLVGEGKIIEKQGRGVTSPEKVATLLAKEAPKQVQYAQIDPAEYYKDSAFSRDQLKSALKMLEGEEKQTFAAMFPDSVLLEAGMAKKDIKQMRDATLKAYDTMLGEAMLGLNAHTDAQLEKEGLAKPEIDQVREAANRIGAEGIVAVHDLKTSPVHENGVEHLLTNLVVHQPKHLGKLIKDGRELFGAESANDGHISREEHRRSTGTHDASRERE